MCTCVLLCMCAHVVVCGAGPGAPHTTTYRSLHLGRVPGLKSIYIYIYIYIFIYFTLFKPNIVNRINNNNNNNIIININNTIANIAN